MKRLPTMPVKTVLACKNIVLDVKPIANKTAIIENCVTRNAPKHKSP
jgi:hypothetical protein